ncbi:hypothetical protein PPSIR1_14900 [Plesiocystis pacifica SIR-1]|uniref:Uncharacterized protein n=1 Tax=Plesiocystis pacifica SIR-1 TaxID=391625 RepID=A6G6A7_9BACT|nr:hypothetical protein PPSIR1_14900 [Plesiocystis pacifica SIR-1]
MPDTPRDEDLRLTAFADGGG